MELLGHSSALDLPSEQVLELLSAHPFVEGMAPTHLEMLAAIAQPIHLDVGRRLFQERAPADRVCLIIKGRIALEVFMLDEGAIPIQTIGPGEVVGWSWFVPPYKWRFDARAVENTDALALDATRLLPMLEQNPILGFEFMKRMAAIVEQRLEATKEQLLDAYTFRR
jgi:CRP/FNR family transcriptional regulator, cyclic AMP receptor protein